MKRFCLYLHIAPSPMRWLLFTSGRPRPPAYTCMPSASPLVVLVSLYIQFDSILCRLPFMWHIEGDKGVRVNKGEIIRKLLSSVNSQREERGAENVYKRNKDLFIFSLYFFFASTILILHPRNAVQCLDSSRIFLFFSLLVGCVCMCVCIILNLYATFIYVSLVAFMYKVIIFRVRQRWRFFSSLSLCIYLEEKGRFHLLARRHRPLSFLSDFFPIAGIALPHKAANILK